MGAHTRGLTSACLLALSGAAGASRQVSTEHSVTLRPQALIDDQCFDLILVRSMN